MQAYGRWLTFLTDERPGLLRLPFVDPDRSRTNRRVYLPPGALNASCTVWNRISLLADAIQAMAPETELNWMRPVIARLHRKVQPSRLKRHRLVGLR